ncbi:MAG: FAD-dependent oxidoreductase [Hyphomonadaceae bacterium]|nr:FAD-dependent oxidoreductase [Hyphomonadaceae bacterium]
MKIAVIGLGVVGLSVCARLARAGHAVSGFEQFELMHANGSSHGDTRIIRLTPGEGPIYLDMARRAHEIWQFWESLAGVQLNQWTGGLMAGPPGSAFVASCAALSDEKNKALLRGDAIYYLTRGALAFPREWDVCRQDDAGVTYADPAREFLIGYAQANGAKLRANVKIDAPISSNTLTIDGEAHGFDAIIVCAGAWAGKLLPEFAKRFVVRRRVLGWMKPLKAIAPPPVLCVDNETGLFGMPTPDGLYKIGLHVVGDRVDPDHVTEPDDDDAALLRLQAVRYMPLFDPEPVRMARCLYTLTADENFLVTPSQENPRALLMSCCSGHGFKYAPIYGDIALDWIEQRPSKELEAFSLTPKRAGAATGLGAA